MKDNRFETLQKCPLCFSTDIKILYSSIDTFNQLDGTFFLSKCQACKLHFQNPRIKEEYIHEFYPDSTPYYHISNPKLHSKQREILKYNFGYFSDESKNWLKSFLFKIKNFFSQPNHTFHYKKSGRLLELGTANGRNLMLYKNLGWSTKGYDFNETAIAEGKKTGLDIEVKDFNNSTNLTHEYESYDAVLLSMVLEHLYYYDNILELTNNLLTSDGQVIITIPTYNGSFHLFGKHTYSLHLPCHIYFFSPKHIKELLKKHNFYDIKISYQRNKNDFLKSLDIYSKYNQNWYAKTLNIRLLKTFLAKIYARLSSLGFSSRLTISAKKK